MIGWFRVQKETLCEVGVVLSAQAVGGVGDQGH